MAKRVKFSEEGAKRIIAATRAYERGNRDQSPIEFRTPGDDLSIRVGRTTAEWPKGGTHEVQLGYIESCDDEDPSEKTVEAINLWHPVAAGVRVLIAQALNGCWYLIEAESCGDILATGCCAPAISGEDVSKIPGYDATKTQVIGHEEGCLRWITTYTCPAEG